MARPTSKEQAKKEAKQLLESQTLNDIFKQLEEEYIEAWKASDTVELRERFHIQTLLVERLKDAIHERANERLK